MKLSIEVKDEETRRRLAALEAAVGGPGRRDLMAALGKGLEQDLQRHFLRRNREPGKGRMFGRAMPKQNFWARMRRATAYQRSSEEEAVVAVSDPAMAARVRGAVIKPTGGRRNLAIPVRPEAAGVLPRSGLIPGLFPKRSARGNLFLMAADSGGALRAYYLLKRQVVHPVDPKALPEDESVQAAAARRVESFLRRVQR